MSKRPKVYKNFVAPESGKVYQITAQTSGTSKIEDVTAYLEQGDTWSAGDANHLWDAVEEAARQSSVSIVASQWTGTDSPFTQVVTIENSKASSKVDLQPDSTVIQQLLDDGCNGLYIQNDAGTLTAYAVGSAPTVDLTIQCTLTEVN